MICQPITHTHSQCCILRNSFICSGWVAAFVIVFPPPISPSCLCQLPLILPPHYIHTHTPPSLFLQGYRKPAALSLSWGWQPPIWLSPKQSPNPRCHPRLLHFYSKACQWGSWPPERALLIDFKINHTGLTTPLIGFDNNFLRCQRICWHFQITAVHQNWILKFRIK